MHKEVTVAETDELKDGEMKQVDDRCRGEVTA